MCRGRSATQAAAVPELLSHAAIPAIFWALVLTTTTHGKKRLNATSQRAENGSAGEATGWGRTNGREMIRNSRGIDDPPLMTDQLRELAIADRTSDVEKINWFKRPVCMLLGHA